MTAEPHPSCDDCPAAALNRRAFFRDLGIAVGAAIGATALLPPGEALAQLAEAISPVSSASMERTYAVPKLDGVFVDEAHDVILARWQNRAYAFSIKCPHKGTRLTWRAAERRVYCPKHKARFAPDGAHVTGRGKRDLDRYGLRRNGETLVVDTSSVLRSDRDAEGWAAASVVLS